VVDKHEIEFRCEEVFDWIHETPNIFRSLLKRSASSRVRRSIFKSLPRLLITRL
jgi:hypothetical protein